MLQLSHEQPVQIRNLPAIDGCCMDISQDTHRDFLHGTQLFSQKAHTQNPTAQAHHWQQLLVGLWSLQTRALRLWHMLSITVSPFQGKSIWVQYFFFSSTLQYRKCYWWTAPKIHVICRKIIQIYELLLCRCMSWTTGDKSKIFFLI